MLKECKIKECLNELQQQQWRNKKKPHNKTERWDSRGFKHNQNKKQAGNSQRLASEGGLYWKSESTTDYST